MKKNIFTLLALLCFTMMANAQGVNFVQKSFKQVLEQAAKENKLVFIDVYAVWCGPCKRMDATTFKDAEVGTFLNKHFVSTQIDAERGEGPSIHTKYAVVGLPSYLFLDKEGNMIHRGSSYKNVEKFLKFAKEAIEISNNPNSVLKYAIRYEKEKNDVAFLKEYLAKLKESKSGAHYEVVEQYLSLQKEMTPTSKEMVMFLNDHFGSLTFGGVAQQIFEKNLGSYAWDKYVRKDIRAKFQGIWQAMAKQTTEYAIEKKDKNLLNMTFEQADNHGVGGDRNFVWKHFYMQSQDAENYKKVAKPMIDAFVKELKPSWNMEYQAFLKFKKKNPQTRPFCEGKSGKLRTMCAEFSKFVTTDEDKAAMLAWGKQAYTMLNNPQNISFYAKIQYMYGDKETGLKMMRENLEATKTVGKYDANAKDLEFMEKGLPIPITF